MTTPIYLDEMASTRLAPEAREAMLPWLGECFGNASSATHAYGWAAAEAVEQAREDVARLLGAARTEEVVFTSGATESSNTVVKGVAGAFAGAPVHVVTSAIEHPSLLEACEAACAAGVEVTRLAPGADGVVDPDAFAQALRPHTRLVSLMAVNNEVGTIQPIAEVAAIARARGILVHVDAAQAVGKLDLGVERLGVDLASVSGHKLYGPQGIGALYVRSDAATRRLPPLLHGGGQEDGRRSGTLPVAQIVGLGAAARLAAARLREDAQHASVLAADFRRRLHAVGGVRLNGSAERRVAGCVNVSIDGVLADALIALVPEVAFSSGSACSSHHGGGSHVLRAMGLDEARRRSAIRVSVGRYTTAEEIAAAAGLLADAIRQLRA
jgi:cysteine desulfurase